MMMHRVLVRGGALILSLALLAGLAWSPATDGTTIYVDCMNTSGVEDGTADHPFDTIQEGINAADTGDTVLVESCTYYENIDFLGKAITVISTDPLDPSLTVIDGGAAGSVVTFASGEGADSVLEGFTITNGDATDGGGIYCSGASPTIRHNRITTNNASGEGGGIYCLNASPTIRNNDITGNSSYYGAGIYLHNSHATIISNYIAGNTGTACGGVFGNNDDSTMTNCIVANNTGGGLYGVADVINCTIVANGGVTGWGDQTICNCIVWDPVSHTGVTYSDVWMDWAQNLPAYTAGEGNISVDPKFVDAANGDYRLLSDSPCRDAGLNAAAPPDDIDGAVRPWPGGGVVDMGAYEYVGAVSPPPCLARTVYVDDSNTSGIEDGTEEYPYNTIQEGIDAVCDGYSVVVAPGIYNENVLFRGKAITVAGTDPLDPAVVADTIIDGGASGRVVTFANGEGVYSVLEGFTIRNGYTTEGGGGIYCGPFAAAGASPTIRHNLITSNSAGTRKGGGICCYGGSPTIAYNTIADNTAHKGGGICCYRGSPTIADNTISGNTMSGTPTSASGGGIYCSWATPDILNNDITGNSCYYGAGIYLHGSRASISSNYIAGNTGTVCGGVFGSEDGSTMTNCIVANNTGGGLYGVADVINCTIVANGGVTGWGAHTICNSIVWDQPVSHPGVTYSDTLQVVAGEGNISEDPLFVDPGAGNYHLALGSPCIDVGTYTCAPDHDIDGDRRPSPFGGGIDMGADEYVPVVCDFVHSPEVPVVGQEVTFESQALDPNGGTIVSIDWDFGDAGTAAGPLVTHEYASAGDYTVMCTVTDDEGDGNTCTAELTVVETADDSVLEVILQGPTVTSVGDTALYVATCTNLGPGTAQGVMLRLAPDPFLGIPPSTHYLGDMPPPTPAEGIAAAGAGLPAGFKCSWRTYKNDRYYTCTGDYWTPMPAPPGMECEALVSAVWVTVKSAVTGKYMPWVKTETHENIHCWPKDPNAKMVAPEGVVSPGETLSYTIEYENVGEGTAYLVYITDTLDTLLDETTLLINDGGTYDPDTRTITWEVGTVLAHAGGSVSFQVNVRGDAAAGAPIYNQGSIYFPTAFDPRTDTNIVVNYVLDEPPTADITFSPQAPSTLDVVTFNANAADADGFVAGIDWDFGDGSTGAGETVTHQFLANGGYMVLCTVTDDLGVSVSYPVIVTVGNLAPTCEVTFEPADPEPGEDVTFHANAADPDPWGMVYAWAWDFGDGNTANDPDPVHAYAATGTYEVCVSVTDDAGASTQCCAWVTIQPAGYPVCCFTYAPASPVEGTPVQFTDCSSDPVGTIVSWSWDFGDGGTSIAQNPTHLFAAGAYDVCLSVTNDAEPPLSSTCCQVIEVGPAPQLCFTLATNCWHMITMPCSPLDPDPWEVFDELRPPNQPLDLLSGNLHRYDHDGMQYVTYWRSSPTAFGPITPGDGYWLSLLATGSETETICCAVECSGETAHLYFPTEGWYLIGSPQPADIVTNDTTWGLGAPGPLSFGEVFDIWVMDPFIGYSCELGRYIYMGVKPIDEDNYLRAFQGYWMYTFEPDLYMSIPPPP